MKYYVLVFLSVISFSAKDFSQKQGQVYIDSLLKKLSNIRNDTVKAKILNKVSLYYVSVNTDSAIKYAAIGMGLVERMKWDKGISAFNTCYGNAFTQKGILDSANYFYLRALEFSLKDNDIDGQSVAYNNLGASANAKSDFVKASDYYTKALQLAEAAKNKINIGYACENLALVYQYQNNVTKSFAYVKRAIISYTENGESELLIHPYSLMGDLFNREKEFDSANYYYQNALQIAKKDSNRTGEASVLNSMAENYFDKKDYVHGISYAKASKKIWDEFNPNSEAAIINTGFIGSNYYQLTVLKKQLNPIVVSQIKENSKQLLVLAIQYLQEAVNKFKKTGNKAQQAQFQEDLALAYEMKGNYKQAYFNYKQAKTIQDSLFSQKNKNKIAALESQNEIDKKNREIETQKLNVREQKKNILFLMSGLIAVIIVGILFYRLSFVRKQKNKELTLLNEQLDNANKTKAKFFAILSHDLRSPIANLVNFLHLQQNNNQLLTEEQKKEQENKISKSALSLLDVMEGMLLWSKGQMESFKPEKTEVPVSNLFSYLQNFFSAVQSVNFQYIAEDGLLVYTDENFLKTIMHNLTQNSVKALSQIQNASITWKAWKKDNLLQFSISDNGLGMTNEQIKKFEDDTSVSSSKQGLGLHIIKDMAKAINCRISLQPNVPTGATFILSFSI